jgi:putative DNA modification/repair radical SAM protein
MIIESQKDTKSPIAITGNSKAIEGDSPKEVFLGNSSSLQEKLSILSDAAKYDVACTSSGVTRKNDGTGLGNTYASGICHSFTADGRCVSLLKVLFTNECVYDCKYCYNRSSNDVPRASFTPDELCTLVIQFYRRNYIEGLFLSSGVLHNPDYTMELIFVALYKLRVEHNFQGYIHIKVIPGTDLELVNRIGFLADRISVNLELPTNDSLKALAPQKSRKKILEPMRFVQNKIVESKEGLSLRDNKQYAKMNSYDKYPLGNSFRTNLGTSFAAAGQSTQMIIGATPETDYQIMTVAEKLYDSYALKRVFYSAYIPVNEDKLLPAINGEGPPLLREHRLYQADWLLRFYHFKTEELLDEENPSFNVFFDPKCTWAIKHLEHFPVEVNKADYKTLLRVPGIGVKSARRIIAARRHGTLDFPDIKKMGVVLKRALYFITCNGKMMYATKIEEDYITRNLLKVDEKLPDSVTGLTYKQMSLFDAQSSFTEVLK